MIAMEILFISACLLAFREVQCTTIRGVALSNLPFYNPTKNFSCLDGSMLLPFSSVNDDYCDCEDGSDEPGTSACSNASFFCINAGYKGESIRSNRVNDGVCDCCDGSDEYDEDVQCKNTCREKGQIELERLKRLREETEKGYKIKVDEMARGKLKKDEHREKLTSLKALLETQKANLEELRAAKERVEAPEKEAKERHEKQWEAEKEARKREREQKTMSEAFQLLDTNKDALISYRELMTSQFLDKDLTDTEAKELLSGSDEVNIDTFSGLWDKVKERYLANGRQQPQEETSQEQREDQAKEATSSEEPEDFKSETPGTADGLAPGEVEGEKDDEEEEEEEETEEDKSATERQTHLPPKPEESREEEEMPDYDQETKRLMLIADEARNQFEDVNSQVKKTEEEISNIEKALSYDFGAGEEFSYLYGQCYELNDREYQYRLCPFSEAVQGPKGGGGDTSLGHWRGWVGEANKYTRMRFDGGVGCWNGPARSTEVNLQCGATTELVSVTEPNRCEYLMEFRTPSLCPDPATLPHIHEEL